jgi:hypothetical protein
VSLEVLHERVTSHLHVRLLWLRDIDRVFVAVHDRSSDEAFVVAPPKASALDAFYHPFCYQSTSAALA